MRQFWYLTKGKLKNGTDLRAYSKAPRAGTPFIAVDYDRKSGSFKLYDDNGNFIRAYKDETIEPRSYRDHPLDKMYNPELAARNYPDLGNVVHAELHKMRFERGYGDSGERNEAPYRMMDEYVDRKKKTSKAKPKRKVAKKKKGCGCK